MDKEADEELQQELRRSVSDSLWQMLRNRLQLFAALILFAIGVSIVTASQLDLLPLSVH